MGAKPSTTTTTNTRRVAYMSTIQLDIAETLKRRSVIPTKSSIPTPFMKFQSFSEEWNLCGKYDSSRRVNVVSDEKLQRRRLPHLLVDKCVKTRSSESVQMLRNELEMLLFILRYAQIHDGHMHPHIIQLRGYYAFRKKIHVFVEFCELGSLERAYVVEPNALLRLNFAPIESEVRDAMRQIVSGVAYLHANGVAHCDLALENVFVTSQNVLKIGDFDHAVFVGTENQRQLWTIQEPLRRIYGAPELYGAGSGGTGSSHDMRPIDLQKADVWALGIVLIRLYTKKPMFDSTAVDDKGFQLFQKVGLRAYLRAMYLEQVAICKFSDAMLDLLEGLLQVDATKRISAAEAMDSEWLQSGLAPPDGSDVVAEDTAAMKRS